MERFVSTTYGILKSENVIRKNTKIYVIECDHVIQRVSVVNKSTDIDGMFSNFSPKGFGGTDFRPAFEYVNTLKVTGQLNGLKGLIYFTDGKGIYPVAAPTYDVAFVFIKERFSEEDFPAWAMRVVLDEETFNERRQ